MNSTSISVSGYWNERLTEVVSSGMRQSKAQIVSEALECTFLPEGLAYSGNYQCVFPITAACSIFALSI